jgi:hypothetical protein
MITSLTTQPIDPIDCIEILASNSLVPKHNQDKTLAAFLACQHCFTVQYRSYSTTVQYSQAEIWFLSVKHANVDVKPGFKSIDNLFAFCQFNILNDKTCVERHLHHTLFKIMRVFFSHTQRSSISNLICRNILKFSYYHCTASDLKSFNNKQYSNLQSIIHACDCMKPYTREKGGAKWKLVKMEALAPYVVSGINLPIGTELRYDRSVPFINEIDQNAHSIDVVCNMPLSVLIKFAPVASVVNEVVTKHKIQQAYCVARRTLAKKIDQHKCDETCEKALYIFRVVKMNSVHVNENANNDAPIGGCTFPPPPKTKTELETIVNSYCKAIQPASFEQSGCLVCGKLYLSSSMVSPHVLKDNVELLAENKCTRRERFRMSDPIEPQNGPVIAPNCKKVCRMCVDSLCDGRIPRQALATGLWIGEQPAVLKNLTYLERMLISPIRRNYCVSRVSMGGHKLVANAVMFSNPIEKIYTALPPPIADINDIIAVYFTGPVKPVPKLLRRTPFFVRRHEVWKALTWLKLNNPEYEGIEIDEEQLLKYPMADCPVAIEYEHRTTNKIDESYGLDDHEQNDGSDTDTCPFRVHGLASNKIESMSLNDMKTAGISYLQKGGKMLGIGYAEEFESIYNNTQLYPRLFPWLFPYGVGGIGSGKLQETEHIRHLLLYYDRRFQTDPEFPLIAFNHKQIKTATRCSWLSADRKKFDDVAERLKRLNPEILEKVANKLRSSESTLSKDMTEEETDCFCLLRDLDLVSWNLPGSITAKRQIRNEIWSLIGHCGAPTWYITISPSDTRHPISVHMASGRDKFTLELDTLAERTKQVTGNPVAAAQFFDMFVQLFIKHVLQTEQNAKVTGLFGDTCAYYGTVEQQGRLTQHLHLLLWIRRNLNPQEVRERLMKPDGEFTKALIAYLESTHQGGFSNGKTMDDVKVMVDARSKREGYIDARSQLPQPCPPMCKFTCGTCDKCIDNKAWWKAFDNRTNEILYRSNIHNCSIMTVDDHNVVVPICKIGRTTCKARFPRPEILNTTVDVSDGHITLKKEEGKMNTFSAVLTYLTGCNTDVTALSSGTGVKAIIAYVSDYVSKSPLKTYMIFDTVRNVYKRNNDIINGSAEQGEMARKVMNKIVNALSARMEIGGPMACMYLLGYPDHYTGHRFQYVNWHAYVSYVENELRNEEHEDALKIFKTQTEYVGVDHTMDYRFRPEEYEDMCVYDWCRLARRTTKFHSSRKDIDQVDQFGIESDTYLCEEGGDNRISCEETYEHTKNKKGFQFMKDHPLVDTHIVRCVKDDDKLVANFGAGLLPRRDGDDREYYARTMCILFAPWRKADEVKDSEESWNECFNRTSFKKRHEEIMNNIQLRYECKDARDDFAQEARRQGKLNVQSLPWMEKQILLDQCQDEDIDLKIDLLGSDGRLKSDGPVADKWQALRDKLTAQLIKAGWFEKESNNQANSMAIDYFQCERAPDIVNWKHNIDAAVQKVRDGKKKTALQNSSPGAAINMETLNTVMVLDEAYLKKSFNHQIPILTASIDKIINEKQLNAEQQRAFHIIAMHIAGAHKDQQLKMYIGGMGGTGKTTVLQAVIRYLHSRGELHKLLIIAPTGGSAALLGGATYHSALGLSDFVFSPKKLDKIREQLEGIEYVFFDEISMVACKELTNVSERLCMLTGCDDFPFGKLNMIFAGDFGQLPPVMGGEQAALYALLPRKTDVKYQRMAIGKALWHQITVVVILRQNMRQHTQTTNDSKLRRALENMRFRACTSHDIRFLESCCARAKSHKGPRISTHPFWHASVITGYNIHRDQYNELGCKLFAKDTGQNLEEFYSMDSLAGTSKSDHKEGHQAANKKINDVNELYDSLQKLIWDLPASAGDTHLAGKLKLCLGMPVIIKHNVATDLCITNGQEGVVAGWDSVSDSNEHQILQTLYIKLSNPPQNVAVSGLPENVVPIEPVRMRTKLKLPSGHTLTVYRRQVQVLPCFAITDYASQGKTRLVNIVDLTHCHGHQSYYTALSRTSRADSLAIVSDITDEEVTGGLSPNLRLEFQHLEILDEITRLKYEGRLPPCVRGERRYTLIQAYQEWKGKLHCPRNVPRPLRWTELDLAKCLDLSQWKLKSNKRKRAQSSERKPKNSKRQKTNNVQNTNGLTHAVDKIGPKWDSTDWSCAYDTVLSVLYTCWNQHQTRWTPLLMGGQWPWLHALVNGFQNIRDNRETLDSVRDSLRMKLHSLNANKFPLGNNGASVIDVLEYVTSSQTSLFQTQTVCVYCNHDSAQSTVAGYNMVMMPDHTVSKIPSLAERAIQVDPTYRDMCNHCKTANKVRKLCWTYISPFVVYELCPDYQPVINQSIVMSYNANYNQLYTLQGVIYIKDYHFISIIWQGSNTVFYDGIKGQTGRKISIKNPLDVHGYRPVCAIYRII